MMMNESFELGYQKIRAYDYSKVIDRLIKIEHWKPKHAKAAVAYYKNFLCLKKKYGDQFQLPPSYEVDEAWHAHILHTKDYHEFCQDIFGGYLHHHPHIAEEAQHDKSYLDKLFQKTQELHLQEFGEYLYEIRPKSWWRRIFS